MLALYAIKLKMQAIKIFMLAFIVFVRMAQTCINA
jgi:hypothetical protein